MKKFLFGLYSALILLNLWMGWFVLKGWYAFAVLVVLSIISIGGVAHIARLSRSQHHGNP